MVVCLCDLNKWKIGEKDMERRVVITGLGAITPIGKDVNESWNSILNKNVELIIFLYLIILHLKQK